MFPPEPRPTPGPVRKAPVRSPWWSRETRLLLMTIVISVGFLLVLARFRFPTEGTRAEAPPQPLASLATRATYDELASIVERLDRRIAPSVVVLRVHLSAEGPPRTLRQVLDHQGPVTRSNVYLPAVRVRPDVALAILPPDATVLGVLGDNDAVPFVIASDPLRQLALVRVPGPADPLLWPWQAAANVLVPRYVVAVEGSGGGQTLRPIFLGRADRFVEPRWATPLLVLSSAPVTTEGSFVFSLEGQLIGLVVSESGMQAVVPAAFLERVANDLLEFGSPTITDFGLALRPLTAATARKYGVTSGVIVASVEPDSLADDHLRQGDLIQSIDGQPAVVPDTVLLHLAQAAPGRTVTLGVRRGDDTLTRQLAVPAAPVRPAQVRSEPDPPPAPRNP